MRLSWKQLLHLASIPSEWRHGHEGDPIEIIGEFEDIEEIEEEEDLDETEYENQ